PSITNRIACSGSRPRSTRSASSVRASVAFSVDPSHSPSGIFTPSVEIPSATTWVRSAISKPSSIITARRTSSRRRDMRSPIGVPLALWSDDLIDLELHQLMHDPEADTDAEREQSLPRCTDELAECLQDLRWERALDRLRGRDDLRRGYLLHGGSSCPRGLGWRLSRSQRERTRREDRRSKFYEISDNLHAAHLSRWPGCLWDGNRSV